MVDQLERDLLHGRIHGDGDGDETLTGDLHPLDHLLHLTLALKLLRSCLLLGRLMNSLLGEGGTWSAQNRLAET